MRNAFFDALFELRFQLCFQSIQRLIAFGELLRQTFATLFQLFQLITQAIQTGDLIARVVAQTSRQSGLSVVYTELMNFGGIAAGLLGPLIILVLIDPIRKLTSLGVVRVFVESWSPPPQMWIFGAVDFTAALATHSSCVGNGFFASQVSAPDPLTVVFDLGQPQPLFEAGLGSLNCSQWNTQVSLDPTG